MVQLLLFIASCLSVGVLFGPLLLLSLFCGFVGMLIGKPRGRRIAGFWLGFWPSLVGIFIAFFLTD
jgi:hypothetical protein